MTNQTRYLKGYQYFHRYDNSNAEIDIVVPLAPCIYLSSCRVYQSVSELILTRCHNASENVSKNTNKNSIVLARALARERGVSLSCDILERAVQAVGCVSGVTGRSQSMAFDGDVMLG
jgi:hypothetical protein